MNAKPNRQVKRTPRVRPQKTVEVEVSPELVADLKAKATRASYTPRPVVYQVDNHWFKAQMADSAMSLRDVAKAIGMDPTALSLTLLGKRKMSVAEAGKIAHALDVPIDEVLARAGVDLQGKKSNSVALAGFVDLDGEVNLGPVMGPTTTYRPDGIDNLTAVRIDADTMMDGWVLFYRESRTMGPEAVDRLCIVTTRDRAKPWLCWVRKGHEIGVWKLVSFLHAKDERRAQVITASPVLWMKQ